MPRLSSDLSSSESQTPSSSTDGASRGSSFKKRRRRGNKLKPLITGAGMPASPAMSMSPNSVLHHFCADAVQPSGSTTHGSLPIPQQLKPSTSSDFLVTPIQPGRRSRWDQLEEGLKDLDASGYQPALGEAHQRLFYLLDSILSTKKSYRCLLQYRDERAQLLVNALQWFLSVHPSLEGQQKRKLMQALLRLSKRAKLLPRSFKLQNIDIREVIVETPNVDICRGLHGGREVCLKKYRVRRQSQSNAIREDLVELLIRESIIWYNHRHPNLLSFEGVYRPDNDFEKAYLVSPFLANGTVVEYLKKFPLVERRLLLLDVLSGLWYLHNNNIVHGDIKGANVLVDSQGRACLADLGLSRLTDAQILTWPSIQSTVPPWGSLLWQAPELLLAQLQEQFISPTTSSDVYAVGCLAYEIFTGLLPFEELTGGRSYIQLHRIISTEVTIRGRRPQKPAVNGPAYLCYGLTDSIWEMMEKCWDREPRLRPSVDDLSRLPYLVDVFDNPLVEK